MKKLFKSFRIQHYNEFSCWVRWHDYVNFTVNEFAVFKVRRYDWLDKEKSTFMVWVLGFNVYRRIYPMR